MNSATILSLHVARLLSQLIDHPGDHEAHRRTLGELLLASREAATLSLKNWQLVAGGEVLSPNMPGLHNVVARMASHGVREIVFAAGAEPAHVLAAIRVLASDAAIGDGGANAMAQLAKLGATSVAFVPDVVPAPAQAAAASRPSPGAALTFDDFEFHDEPATRRAFIEPKLAIPPPGEPERDGGALYQQFATPAAEQSPAQVVARLKSVGNLDELARTMGAIAGLMETARSADKAGDAAGMLQEVLACEPRFTDPEAKRIFSQIVRRMATPAFFKALVADLPAGGEKHAQYMAIFARFGDEAIDPLIERLAYAESAKERRVLFEAIVELRRGVPMVMHMLDDGRWYVVRNAAEILGEIRATEAEAALIESLRHTEERVRRSAALALAKLGTATAIAALKVAMRDASPSVRMQATLAVATLRDRRMTGTLILALEEEEDSDVQRTLLMALGKVATPDAVRRLITAAEPAGRWAHKKRTSIRVAAVQALAEARTPEALVALEAAVKDREREVRDAATKGLAAAANAESKGAGSEW